LTYYGIYVGTLYGPAALVATTAARFGGNSESDSDEETNTNAPAPAAASPPPPKKLKVDDGAGAKSDEAKQNSDDEDPDRECKICMDAQISTVIIPWFVATALLVSWRV
jgi:hypothetical protein